MSQVGGNSSKTEEEKNSASPHPTAAESMTDKDDDDVESGAGFFYAKDAPLWSAAFTSASLERPRPCEATFSPAKKKPKTDVRYEILMLLNKSDTTDDQEVDKERKTKIKTKKSKDKKKNNNKKAINIKKLSAFQLSKQNRVTFAKFMQKTIPKLMKV